MLRQRKSIRYNVLDAQKNPFEAAAGKSPKLSNKTVVCTEVPHTALQEDGKSDLSVIQPNSDFSNHAYDATKSKNPFETEADELSDAGDAELLLRTAELPEPEDTETTLPDRKSDLSVRHPSSPSIKRHFN